MSEGGNPMTPDDELAACRAAVAQANTHQATCPHCGQPLPGGTPAQDEPKDVSADRGPVPTMSPKQHESWRDRPPLL